MKPSGRNLNLTSYDEIFQTEESRAEAFQEKIVEIPLSELHPFKNHPFKVTDDESMFETAESVKQHGILVPMIARPREEGGYELISGHRRKRACELAGKETLPVIVRDLDDDAATIIMVDSNIQRENILPSERAFAYKLKLEALKRQAGRPLKENAGQLDPHFDNRRSNVILAEQAGESVKQVQRFIRLTELVPELLDMVDTKKIAFNPAVELSYLNPPEQIELMEAMDMEQSTPSLSQAQRLKKYSHDGKLTFDVMTAIMSEDKKGELEQAGYIIRTRERNEYGHLKGTDYTIFEKPHLLEDPTQIREPILDKPVLRKPMLGNPILDNPVLEKPTLENPTQLNTKKTNKDPLMTKGLNKHPSIPDTSREAVEKKDEMGLDAQFIKESIQNKIEYEIIVQRFDNDRLDEIVDLMVETLCSKREYITVAGDDYPASLVKERLERIDSTHIEYVFECLDKNTTLIRNIKKYLLTTLFNASSTIDSYYTALVKHDLYGAGSHFYEDLGNLIKSNK